MAIDCSCLFGSGFVRLSDGDRKMDANIIGHKWSYQCEHSAPAEWRHWLFTVVTVGVVRLRELWGGHPGLVCDFVSFFRVRLPARCLVAGYCL